MNLTMQHIPVSRTAAFVLIGGKQELLSIDALCTAISLPGYHVLLLFLQMHIKKHQQAQQR